MGLQLELACACETRGKKQTHSLWVTEPHSGSNRFFTLGPLTSLRNICHRSCVQKTGVEGVFESVDSSAVELPVCSRWQLAILLTARLKVYLL
jgi:hypothetical protein